MPVAGLRTEWFVRGRRLADAPPRTFGVDQPFHLAAAPIRATQLLIRQTFGAADEQIGRMPRPKTWSSGLCSRGGSTGGRTAAES